MMWLIEPHDPLLVRDGRPFKPTPGARARSLPFPFPSTTTGAARTRAGEVNGGRFDPAHAPSVANIPVRGPLLVEVGDDGAVDFFAPAPGDALPFDTPDGRLEVLRLAPLTRPAGAVTDLDGELSHTVGLSRPKLDKPAKRPPAFWRWDRFAAWLLGPADANFKRADLGIDGPPVDRRMHVGIDPTTLTGRDGALFMTSGLTFWRNDDMETLLLSGARRLALAVDVGDTGDLSLDAGFGPMGGERRLMHWRAADEEFPSPPDGLREQVIKDRACRVILLTPACFAAGWRPEWLLAPRAGVTAELVAAAVGKPATVSGWDLKIKSARLSRRLAPAGSVYYLRLTGDDDAISHWFDATWMTCVSDMGNDNASGFGLAAVGVWSGTPETMEMEEV